MEQKSILAGSARYARFEVEYQTRQETIININILISKKARKKSRLGSIPALVLTMDIKLQEERPYLHSQELWFFFMLWFLMNAPMFQAKVALAIRYLDGSNSKCSPISAKYKLIHNLWKRATD